MKEKIVKAFLPALFSKKGAEEKTEPEKHLGEPLNPREVKDKSRESFFAYFLFKESKARGKAAEYMPNPTICRKKVEGERGFAYTGNRKRGGRHNAD